MFRTIRLFLIRLLAGDSINREFEDVFAFHTKFGQLAHREPGHISRRAAEDRRKFLQEEVDEFNEAAQIQDLDKMADALVDIVYVALGTAVKMGLPWQALWNDVQRANMAKVVGVTHRGGLVDVKKPEGWVPPKTMEILERHGYCIEDWKNEDLPFCHAGTARDYKAYNAKREAAGDPEFDIVEAMLND